MSFYIFSSKAKKWSSLIFEIQFPILLFFMFVQNNHKMESEHLKNKMNNPQFVDEETIALVQDEDCVDYNTPVTSR